MTHLHSIVCFIWSNYYQNHFAKLFLRAALSIFSATSKINNARNRYQKFMIGQLVFLGGIIYSRLLNNISFVYSQFILSPTSTIPLLFQNSFSCKGEWTCTSLQASVRFCQPTLLCAYNICIHVLIHFTVDVIPLLVSEPSIISFVQWDGLFMLKNNDSLSVFRGLLV